MPSVPLERFPLKAVSCLNKPLNRSFFILSRYLFLSLNLELKIPLKTDESIILGVRRVTQTAFFLTTVIKMQTNYKGVLIIAVFSSRTVDVSLSRHQSNAPWTSTYNLRVCLCACLLTFDVLVLGNGFVPGRERGWARGSLMRPLG